MKKFARLIALVVIATMLCAGCGDKGNVTNNENPSVASDEEKVLNCYFANTPETFNPHTVSKNYELVNDVTATLYRQIYDEKSKTTKLVPGLAEGNPVPQDEEHKVWTIKVAKGYKFADGTKIDANTVEYSMKMLNDPKLANRNVNAADFLNGSKYLEGKCEWSEVGFKATDDYTLQVTFEKDHEPEDDLAVRWIFEFIGSGVVHPDTYEACMNGDRTECSYGSTIDKFVASGLYKPTNLIQGQFLELTRWTDDEAPLGDVYTPDKVNYQVVTDANTAVQLFEQGKLDAVVANQSAYDEYPGARYVYTNSNQGIFLNGKTPTAAIIKDVNFRYALYWGLDRESLVKAVFPTSLPSAYMYLPYSNMPDPSDPANKTVKYYETDEAKAVRMDGHPINQKGYDPDLAKEYFDKAYQNNGGGKVTITALYTDGEETSKTWAEAVQKHYQTLFGEDRLEIKLQAVPSSIIYEKISRDKMDYDMCLSCGWGENIVVPWNNSHWVHSGPYTWEGQYCAIADDKLAKEWDDMFYKCTLYDWKWDAQKKLEATAKMEEVLYNDCSYVPAYDKGNRYFFSSKISPVLDTGHPELFFCLMQAKFN